MVSVSTLPRSACVIWPIFSASVIRDSRSWTRWLTGSAGFWYGNGLCVMRARGVGAAVPRRADRRRGDRHGGERGPRHGEQPAP